MKNIKIETAKQNLKLQIASLHREIAEIIVQFAWCLDIDKSHSWTERWPEKLKLHKFVSLWFRPCKPSVNYLYFWCGNLWKQNNTLLKSVSLVGNPSMHQFWGPFQKTFETRPGLQYESILVATAQVQIERLERASEVTVSPQFANKKKFRSNYMDVSKNRGTPKSSILIGFAIINHPFWGTSIFGNTHIWTCPLLELLEVKSGQNKATQFMWPASVIRKINSLGLFHKMRSRLLCVLWQWKKQTPLFVQRVNFNMFRIYCFYGNHYHFHEPDMKSGSNRSHQQWHFPNPKYK